MRRIKMEGMLGREFFREDQNKVAKRLIRKGLLSKNNGKWVSTMIVETEAYFGNENLGSRARFNGEVKRVMEMKEGSILVLGVHNNWLFNIVTGKDGVAGAVLIKTVEAESCERPIKGPGLLTRALGISKEINGVSLFLQDNISIADRKDRLKRKVKIGKSFRIGLKKDPKEKVRYSMKDNISVSRRIRE